MTVINITHHDFTAGYVANEHIDHSGVSISAGGILSGGGDITSSRTISLAQSDVDHAQISNTHNLTSDIDHGSINGLSDIADHPGFLDLGGTRDMTGDLTLTGLDSTFDVTGITKTTQFDNLVKWGPLTGWSTWFGGAHGDVQEGILLRTAGSHIYSFFGTDVNSTKLSIGIQNENYPRLAITAGGILNFGGASVTFDTNLYRSAASILKTDDHFQCPNLTVDNININGLSIISSGSMSINTGSDALSLVAGANVNIVSNDNDIINLNSHTFLAADKEISGTKFKITVIGGYAIKLTNKSGSNSVAGDIVEASSGTADAVDVAGANATDPIGIFLDSGVADGSEAWVVIAGIADVHMDAGGCVKHDRIITSATAGRGDVSNAPAVAVHFQEIGHAIEDAGANANARCVIHFL